MAKKISFPKRYTEYFVSCKINNEADKVVRMLPTKTMAIKFGTEIIKQQHIKKANNESAFFISEVTPFWDFVFYHAKLVGKNSKLQVMKLNLPQI